VPGPELVGAAATSSWYALRLARRLRQLRPDVVHANSLKACLYGSFAAKIAGVPFIWHARDRLSGDYLPEAGSRIARAIAARFPSAVIAISQATLLEENGSSPRPTAVIRDPIPLPHVSRRPAASALRMGVIGRIAPWKGQHVFLDAFAKAFPSGTERAVVVGAPLFGEESYERELYALCSRLGLDGRAEFRGFREDVWAELAELDVLVHASVIPEPGGQVVLEGMAAETAVLAPAAGGPAEVIEDGVTGLLYRPGDAVALAETLRRVARDPELRERLGKAGRKKAEAFSPAVIASEIMDVYRSVARGRDR